MRKLVLILLALTSLSVEAGPYSELNPIGSSILSALMGLMFLSFIALLTFKSLKKSLSNPVLGIFYFATKVLPFVLWFIIPLSISQLYPEAESWVYFVGIFAGGYASFKLLDLGEKYFPEDDE